MKKLVIILVLMSSLSISLGSENFDFLIQLDFDDPRTWPEKLVVVNTLKAIKELAENGITQVPPNYFEIRKKNDNSYSISFPFSNEVTSSWYTKDFQYHKDDESYEFLVMQFGGITQRIRFISHKQGPIAYIRESGITGDTGWLSYGRLRELTDSYEP